MYEIEAGIQLPSPRKVPGSSKYPFTNMRVGDSFLVPAASNGVRMSMYTLAKRSGVKIAIRVVDGGVRVWRTA